MVVLAVNSRSNLKLRARILNMDIQSYLQKVLLTRAELSKTKHYVSCACSLYGKAYSKLFKSERQH